MIQTAKSGINDNGNIWLMWGWMVLAASLSQYVMLELKMGAWSTIGWILMPIGGIVTFIYFMMQGKKATVKTHVDQFMTTLWTSFGISIALIIFFVSQADRELIMPLCIILYGIGTYTSGGALKFRPLRIGGLICFACATMAFTCPLKYQLILISIAVVASYIVPGYLLKSQFNKKVSNV